MVVPFGSIRRGYRTILPAAVVGEIREKSIAIEPSIDEIRGNIDAQTGFAIWLTGQRHQFAGRNAESLLLKTNDSSPANIAAV